MADFFLVIPAKAGIQLFLPSSVRDTFLVAEEQGAGFRLSPE
jgi:hypothetical protein